MLQLPLMGMVLADADGVMTLIFVVFAVISWIIKLVNAAKGEAPAPAAGNKPKPQRAKSLEDEIANFLKEVNKKPAGAGADRGRQERERAEVVFEDRPRPADQRAAPQRPETQRPETQRPETQRPAPQRTAPQGPVASDKLKRSPAKTPKPSREGKDSRGQERGGTAPASARQTKQPRAPQTAAGAAQRVAGHAAELGRGVQSHLQSHMSERIGQMVSQDLAPRISDSVTSHLGSATPVTTAATVAKVPEHPLLAELRQPQTLQRAMVASLILAPPRALAKRR
jgi:hypothetical protein